MKCLSNTELQQVHGGVVPIILGAVLGSVSSAALGSVLVTLCAAGASLLTLVGVKEKRTQQGDL